MALIDCPECKSKISDQAESCPHCGYPLQRDVGLFQILVGKRWRAQSGTLMDAVLEATFNDDGSFVGATKTEEAAAARGGPPVITPSEVQGTWVATGSELFLDFPLTMMGIPSPTQIGIALQQISQDRLVGVDKWARPWHLQRIGMTFSSALTGLGGCLGRPHKA